MARDRVELVFALVRHALSPTANENEARSAAFKVCETLQGHPGLLIGQAGPDAIGDEEEELPLAYQRTGKKSEIHPRVKIMLEWKEFKRAHAIQEMGSPTTGLCYACGEPFEKREHVLIQAAVGTTHARCADWWRDYDFTHVPGVPVEDYSDIPF